MVFSDVLCGIMTCGDVLWWCEMQGVCGVMVACGVMCGDAIMCHAAEKTRVTMLC